MALAQFVHVPLDYIAFCAALNAVLVNLHAAPWDRLDLGLIALADLGSAAIGGGESTGIKRPRRAGSASEAYASVRFASADPLNYTAVNRFCHDSALTYSA